MLSEKKVSTCPTDSEKRMEHDTQKYNKQPSNFQGEKK